MLRKSNLPHPPNVRDVTRPGAHSADWRATRGARAGSPPADPPGGRLPSVPSAVFSDGTKSALRSAIQVWGGQTGRTKSALRSAIQVWGGKRAGLVFFDGEMVFRARPFFPKICRSRRHGNSPKDRASAWLNKTQPGCAPSDSAATALLQPLHALRLGSNPRLKKACVTTTAQLVP